MLPQQGVETIGQTAARGAHRPAPMNHGRLCAHRVAGTGTGGRKFNVGDASSHVCAGERVLPRQRRRVVAAGERRSANRAQWSGTASTSATEADVSECRDVAISAHEVVWESARALQPCFWEIDRLIAKNVQRVQQAFQETQVGPHHFQGSNGYGHGDLGRAALDRVMAQVMGTEAAMVRIQLMSGTHAIAAALYGILRPGQRLLAVAGRPYDTLEEVIGLRGEPDIGSLRDFRIGYDELPLNSEGGIDVEGLARAVVPGETRVALIQRSCGYAPRPTLTLEEIGRAVRAVKAVNEECMVVVDNCYGEFTEAREPGHVGADLVIGSLIKCPGGTVAPGGGYVAGRRGLVEKACARMGAPGLSLDAGGVSGETQRLLYQGLWLAPHTVGEALKAGRLIAAVMARAGCRVVPEGTAEAELGRLSYITAVELGSREAMLAFCRQVQGQSPVGSYVQPVPGATPGYDSEVIFADGTFVDGSTSEMSADGPIRPPFVVYCQGGSHWTQWVAVLEAVLSELRSLPKHESAQ